MDGNRFVVTLCSVFLCSGIASADAQYAVAQHAVTQRSIAHGQPGSMSTLPTVTIEAVDLPLWKMLDTIASQAGLTAAYGPAVVNNGARISIRLRNVPVMEAFTRALQGTGLAASVMHGHVAFVRREDIGIREVKDGTITGKVVHAKTKKPVGGARVLLGDVRETVTASDGTFRLLVSAGEYTLQVRAVGFARYMKRVAVANEVVQTEIALDPTASVLDEVIVTGTVIATARKEIPTPVTVIHGEELERRGITRIEELFRGEVPGLFVLDRGTAAYSTASEKNGVSAQVYARGSAGLDGGANPIKTYVDGVELLDPSYLGAIDPRSIERIEIVTGPQAATIYGSGAMGGVMQIFTKRGNRGRDLTLNVRYGILQNSFSDGRTPEHHDVLSLNGGLGSELSYSGSISYDYTGQWQPGLWSRRLGASGGLTFARDRLVGSVSFAATGGTNGTWEDQGGDQFGLIEIVHGRNDYAARLWSNRVSASSSQTVSLNADYRVAAAWNHHLTLGRSQNVMTLRPVAPDFGDRPPGSDTLFQVNRLFGQRLTWSYNTTYAGSLKRISSVLTAGLTGSSGDQVQVGGCIPNLLSSSVRECTTGARPQISLPVNDRNWGGFSQWRIGVFGQLYTTLGIRMEQNPNYGRNVKFDITPTNGLAYSLEWRDVTLKLMGSYGRATRPPSAEQRLEQISTLTIYNISSFVSQLSNPELRPEYSSGPQGGFELYIGNLGSLSVNHYRQTVSDLIQRPVVDSIPAIQMLANIEQWLPQYQYLNVGKVRQTGWEGVGSVNLAGLTLKGAYSWNDSRIVAVHRRASSQYNVGEVFRDVPSHFGNVTIGYANRTTTITTVANFTGATSTRRITRWGYENMEARLQTYVDLRQWGSVVSLPRRNPGYAKSNLSISHRLTAPLTVSLNVVNLTNTFQSDMDVMTPSLGRQTTFGVSYRLGSHR